MGHYLRSYKARQPQCVVVTNAVMQSGRALVCVCVCVWKAISMNDIREASCNTTMLPWFNDSLAIPPVTHFDREKLALEGKKYYKSLR